MTILMDPTELPFTIGSKVWVNHRIGGLEQSEGIIRAIEISDFSFYKNNRKIIEDKPEHKLFIAKLTCAVSFWPKLHSVETYEYWMHGENSFIFLTHQDLLDFLRSKRTL